MVAYLTSQVVDLAAENDALREVLQACLARLWSTSIELTRATATNKALRRENQRYTAERTLGRAT